MPHIQKVSFSSQLHKFKRNPNAVSLDLHQSNAWPIDLAHLYFIHTLLFTSAQTALPLLKSNISQPV